MKKFRIIFLLGLWGLISTVTGCGQKAAGQGHTLAQKWIENFYGF